MYAISVDRLLDPENESVTLLALKKVTNVLGKKLRVLRGFLSKIQLISLSDKELANALINPVKFKRAEKGGISSFFILIIGLNHRQIQAVFVYIGIDVSQNQDLYYNISSMMEWVFEWDPEKERENFEKHGVDFEAAERAFFDYCRMERHDDDSSDDEDRWQTMGLFDDVLFVVYTERGNAVRIISARIAEPFERRIYYGNRETHGWQRVNP